MKRKPASTKTVSTETVSTETVITETASPHARKFHLRERLRGWQDDLRGPCLSALLVLQVLFIFIIIPLTSAGTLPHVFVDIFQLTLALVSVFVLPGRRLTHSVILLGFGLTLIASSVPALDLTQLLHYLGLFLFTGAVSFDIAKVIFSGEVTHNRVQGAIVVYLNLGLIYATLFAYLVHLSPGAFSNISLHPRPQFGQLVYFSLSTLTTAGYGDIVPLQPLARGLCNLEAVSGQLFLATLLARLVNLQAAARK